MVVEDEPLIRMVAVEALIEAGFDVIEADRADNAFMVLTHSVAEVHLLFTDVNMPGAIDGLELAHRLQGLWPQIAVLIASGAEMLGAADLPPGARFLTKPYSIDQVVEDARALTSSP